MQTTKRKPASVGDILQEEFLSPLQVTQGKLAAAMGVSRQAVNEICNNKRMLTIDMALMLAKALNTMPAFWLNVQQQSDLWVKKQ